MFRPSAALFLMFLLGSAAVAGPVEPGSVTNVGGEPWTAPAGDVVATDTRGITYTYVAVDPSHTFTGSNTVDGSLRSTVFRDPATQHLTFFYEFLRGADGRALGFEGGALSLGSFTGFTTDVTAQTSTQTEVSRSGDGAVLTYLIPANGLGASPIIAVATDATDFDSTGSAALNLIDDFEFLDLEGFPLIANATSSVNVSNIFRPIAPGPQPPPNAIPLPPAVWTGLLTLLGVAAYTQRRVASA